MSQIILTQSTPETQSSFTLIYKYSFTVINSDTEDVETLIAAFSNPPSEHDWQQWLGNWNVLGYTLQSTPKLIQVS